MSDCPLCGEDDVCPGQHCLVELADVVAFVRTFEGPNAQYIADSIGRKFDWPPTAQPESEDR